MEHYGDITKIKGKDVPTVDCVIGGSPCQNLSIAGNRKGLDGDQSVLFLEQIRIIKEMRDEDVRNGKTGELIRPRFMVWENVPGAFSSNKGEDFRKVLEETAKIADEDAVIPMPPKNKWTTSGAIMGDGWSIAWRILDAQFWGVPQRRRRIALVADFGGGCAPEILFVKDSLRGDSSESRKERKTASSDAQGSLGADDREGKCYGFPLGFRPENVRCYEETATTLCNRTRAGFCNGIITLESVAFGVDVYNQSITGDKAKTLNSAATDSDHIPCTIYPVNCYDIGDRRTVANESVDVSPTLLSKMGTGGNNVPVVALDRASYNQGVNAMFDIGIDENGVAFSHIAKGPGAVAYIDTTHADDVVRMDDVVAPLQARDYKGGKLIAIEEKEPVICVQGNIVDRGESVKGNGDGWKEGTSYILNTIDKHAVVYNVEEEGEELGETDYTEGFKTLRVLWEDYGEKTIFQWFSSILERIPQEKILQPNLYERSIQSQGTQGNELDDNSLPCPELIAEWVLRDMWESKEYRCSSQGWKCSQQREGKPSEVVSELSCEEPQSCREMLGMWQKGEGIWLLRKALSTFQKMGQSSCCQKAKPYYIVRRLTPLEAERLQGFPDRWTDIGEYTDSNGKKKQSSDTSRYKALGNSIALPSWKWVLKRLCSHYERDATMASLFDGIGGFPYLWEQLNGKGSCLWASEIEDFPIAVTTARIG